MLGDEEGEVRSLRPFNLHGQIYWDVTIEFDDGRIEEARLGPEGVPDGTEVGQRVLVKKAAMIIIALERIA